MSTLATIGQMPLVSAIVVFLDEAEFLEEAIQSVIDQSYPNWELVLVDDGSTDGSTEIARGHASARPDRVRYVDHPDHENRGMSASRNTGVDMARGDYIAYLDGDDRWLPDKLAEHVDLLARHPEARLVYGPLTLWHSWTGDLEDEGRDEQYGLDGVGYSMEPDRVIEPPHLVADFIRHKDLIPAGATFQRSLFLETGGAEEGFRTSYEDAVVLVKMCLRAPVYCTSRSSYLYRQHDQPRDRQNHHSLTPADRQAQSDRARQRFLDWVEEYLTQVDLTQADPDREVWSALRAAQRPYRRPHLHEALTLGRRTGRLAGRTTMESWRHAKLLARRRLLRVPTEEITDEFAFALSRRGWNRYRAVLESYDADPAATLESTAFHRFFNDVDVNAVCDLNDLLALSDDRGPYDGIARFWLGEYPWGGLIGPDVATTGAPYGWAHDAAEDADTSELWGRGRNLWYRPRDDYTIRTEWRRIIELYESIKRRYSPVKARGFPRVTLFIRRDGERRAVIVDGHHRLAVLAHLGAQRVTVEVDAVVREQDIDEWPRVRSGYCTADEALIFFGSFFELDGSERFDHVSAKWGTTSLEGSRP